MKKQKSLFEREGKLPEFYGIGVFEWAAVVGALFLVLSIILKNL